MSTIPEMPAALAGVWHTSEEDRFDNFDKLELNSLLGVCMGYAQQMSKAAILAADRAEFCEREAKLQEQMAQAMARQAHDEIESLRGEVYNLADLLRTSALRALSAVNPADRTSWLVGEG